MSEVLRWTGARVKYDGERPGGGPRRAETRGFAPRPRVQGMVVRVSSEPGETAAPTDRHVVVERVTKRFASFTALQDIDMRIRRGDIVVIIGGSGAGKTTLLAHPDRPRPADQRHSLVDGVDIAPLGERELNKVRRKFGMVFQYSALLDSMTVLENVAFPLREHTKLERQGDRAAGPRQARRSSASRTSTNRFPSQLSGGMRKRVALARALMLEPEVVDVRRADERPRSDHEPAWSTT